MGGFWDAFAVYDKKKHGDPSLYGGNHMNIGESKTQVMFSQEYRAPKTQQAMPENMQNMRRSSMSSVDSSDVEAVKEGKLPADMEIPKNVDISNMSQGEFLRLYKSLRKGEPDNKVNRWSSKLFYALSKHSPLNDFYFRLIYFHVINVA